MHLGIFAKTFPRPSLEEALDAVAAHGLTHTQFNMTCVGLPTLPERLDEDLCIWIARCHRERGLTMAAISGTFNLCDPDAARLEDNLRRLDFLARACRWLDTRLITLCTGTLDPDDMWRHHPENVRRSTWDHLVTAMSQAVKIADRHEVTLAFEPELNNVVNSVCKARRLLDEIGSPWLKVVIDPANLLRPGDLHRMNEVFNEAFDWLGPDIILAHAKNPRIEDGADLAAITDLRYEAVRRARERIRKSRERMQYSEELADMIDELVESCFDATLTSRAFYQFYQPYLNRLRRSGYGGAIIMHGLDESEVESRAALLRKTLKSPEAED